MLRAATTSMPPWDSRRAQRERGAHARGARRAARADRPRRRPRQGRAHLRGALHGRHGLRRHVPAGRPALHARPLRPASAAGGRRAEGARLLGLPAPGRPTGCCSASGRTRRRRARRTGVQLSLFDVSDLRDAGAARPARRSGQDSYTEVENDHHAFLWWAPERLAVIPAVPVTRGLRRARRSPARWPTASTARAGSSERARIAHPARAAFATRVRPLGRGRRPAAARLGPTGVLSTLAGAPGPGRRSAAYGG